MAKFHPTRRRFLASAAGATGALILPAIRYPELAFAARGTGILRHVHLLIGTSAQGNTIPGAQVPFGFASVSPDTMYPGSAGYRTDHDIIGFSHTHVSGVGGGGTYGNFRLTPLVGPLRVNDISSPKANELLAPGYYAVMLARPDIHVEISATRRTGIHRYTFPSTTHARILLDATSVVLDPISGESGYHHQRPLSSRVTVISPDRIDGSVTIVGGYSTAPYTLHFSLMFDRPVTTAQTFVNRRISAARTVTGGNAQRTGVIATFDATRQRVVEARLGMSFVSTAQAHANLVSELGNRSVPRTAGRAQAAWKKALHQIDVEGGSQSEQTLFYTGLYRTHVMPHDLTDENVWTHAKVHYEDYYTLWDTFRTVHPLLSLVQPHRQRDMVQTLVEVYKKTGWLPTARTAGANGVQQVGTHADTVVADALQKGLTGIDYQTAYRGMVKNAEHEPSSKKVAGVPMIIEGRPGLAEYKKFGFVPLEFQAKGRPIGLRRLQVSRTVEYAYNDFCIAQVAKALGHHDDYRKYLARSGNWANLWDPLTHSVRPRHSDGRFLTPYDHAVRHTVNDAYYEGSGYQYSTFVPHDVQGLINRLGGDVGFVAWLDRFFAHAGGPRDNGYYQHYNEPDHLAAYLYIHAGRPDRTADQVRDLLATQYGVSPLGLPGNDDSGAMSAWYVWGAMGLFPNAGQPYYYIGSPIFTQIRIRLEHGRSFVIKAPATSPKNRYVQSASLNGRPLHRAWLHHEEIVRGGQLFLRMGARPSKWARSSRPPSVSKPLRAVTAGAPSGGVMVAPGKSAGAAFKVDNLTAHQLTVQWTAATTGSIAVSPSGGTLTIAARSSGTAHVSVKAGKADSNCSVRFASTTGGGDTLAHATVSVAVANHVDLTKHFNNVAVSADGHKHRSGDNGGFTTYSAEALAAVGIKPGGTVLSDGIIYVWPSVAAGRPDSVRTSGQNIAVSFPAGVTRIGLLGSATHGGFHTDATLKVAYTDGSTDELQIKFSDWTLAGGKYQVLPRDTVAATTGYQNTRSGGRKMIMTYVFAVTAPLPSDKTAKSVTLSPGTRGSISIFAISAK
ncbi:MAG TPA: GH92 family glycosyl hydrolase [Jatrophihabitantaceae bacterium]|nr:GH92 family glycosyl hydrolase [Jatrophihabitantaceae bacterium]